MSDEKEIILRAKDDIRAFDYLYEKYLPMIFSFVMLRVNNREVAEDIVSVVFYKAMKNLALFRWRQIPFSAWLYRIASNEVVNYYKKERTQKRIKKGVFTEDEPVFEEKQENRFSYDFLHHYIRQLNQKEQEIITLRYFEKKPFAEISSLLGKNESSIRVIVHRALKKLEKLIPEEVLEDVYEKVSEIS